MGSPTHDVEFGRKSFWEQKPEYSTCKQKALAIVEYMASKGLIDPSMYKINATTKKLDLTDRALTLVKKIEDFYAWEPTEKHALLAWKLMKLVPTVIGTLFCLKKGLDRIQSIPQAVSRSPSSQPVLVSYLPNNLVKTALNSISRDSDRLKALTSSNKPDRKNNNKERPFHFQQPNGSDKKKLSSHFHVDFFPPEVQADIDDKNSSRDSKRAQKRCDEAINKGKSPDPKDVQKILDQQKKENNRRS